MKDRIKQIMESEHLSPSEFADKLQIGRAVISHILNGRNNPSLDVVTRILSKLNYINSEWLLTGTGEMHKSETTQKVTNNSSSDTLSSNGLDLFSQNYTNPSNVQEKTEYRKENIVESPKNISEPTVNQQIIYQKLPDKKISKIIIYYTDNTFEVFNADNNPL